MDFYLNVTVAGLETTRQICSDYGYWFRRGDETSLTLFFTDRALVSEVRRVVDDLKGPGSAPVHLIADPVPFHELHRFYRKKRLAERVDSLSPRRPFQDPSPPRTERG